MRHAFIAALGVIIACTLPPFEYEGEHVVVATDVVARVCAGTLRSFDRGVEYVDDRLGLPRPDEPLRIAILSDEERRKFCPGSCMTMQNGAPLVVLRQTRAERAMVHETVHARLSSPGPRVPLFQEGIAVALGPARCPPAGEPPDLDELLAATSGYELLDLEGYHAAGELVARLLDVHGSRRVLDFFSTLSRPEAATQVSDPEFVRASYLAHFGTRLDDDMHAHVRDPEQLPPEELGCVASAAPVQGDRIYLRANLDCDSLRVENDFRFWKRGFVDWTLDVPETPSPRRYRLMGPLPADTKLKLVRCSCEMDVKSERAVWDGDSNVGSFVDLEPGTYVVRWEGPLDEGLELDIEIEIFDAE